MDELTIRRAEPLTQHLSVHDVLAILFRRKRMITATFAAVMVGALLAALMLPAEYRSEMKILVKHEREEPVVTAQATPGAQLRRSDLTEEDLNTEVELIRSRDLLEEVVLTCGLDKHNQVSWWKRMLHYNIDKEALMAKALQQLQDDLVVDPVKKSSVIEVSYTSPDRQLAQRVLATIADLYLRKHLAVHRARGAADFFAREAERYSQELQQVRAKLEYFSDAERTVSAQVERDNALQKANEFEATLRQTESAVRETDQRIVNLKRQLASIPPRMKTSDRNQDAQLIAQLRSQLATLELKRTEMLAKFEPSYRPVQDLEAQILQLRTTIAKEESSPVREVTTDNNPTFMAINSDLSKAQADLASLNARAESLRHVVAKYRAAAFELNEKDFAQQELLRDLKTKEQQYLLYVNKHEEARISDALDSSLIVNVAVAEPPTLPFLPVHSPVVLVAIGLVFATVLSAGAAYLAEYTDNSFRTPGEVEMYLDMPVLAAPPRLQIGPGTTAR